MSVLFRSGYFFYTATRVIFPKIQIWLRLLLLYCYQIWLSLNFLPLFAPLYPRSKSNELSLVIHLNSNLIGGHHASTHVLCFAPIGHLTFPWVHQGLPPLCVLSYFFPLFSLPGKFLDFRDSDQQRPLDPQGCLQPRYSSLSMGHNSCPHMWNSPNHVIL